MRPLLSLPIALLLLATPLAVYADQPAVGMVQAFGPNLRSACPIPEGLAVDPVGNLYVASVQSAARGVICVIDREGRLADRIPVVRGGGASSAALTGLVFDPGRGLYALDVGDFIASGGASQDGRLLLIDPVTHAATTVADGFALPNGIAEDKHRNVYVSDSARGNIYRVTPEGTKTVWSQDRLISRHVNDLAFDGADHFLYVVTTGTIVRIPLQADGSAGAAQAFADPSTSTAQNFASGLFSDDGIALDGLGNVFFTAGATSEIFELSSEGKFISRYSGLGADILDEPSALIFHEQNLYISNSSQADGGLHAGLSVLRTLPQTRSAPGFLIHGQVTDAATHTGIQGIDVNAVDASINCCPFHNVAFTQTDANGSYQLLVPPHSSVKLQFFAFPTGTPPYVEQWWRDSPSFDSADTLVVNAETFGINVALLRGVFIHGQVTDSISQAGIGGISVGAVDSAVPCCPFHNLGFTQSKADGSYDLFVAVGSTVKVQFSSFGQNPLPYIEQWWNNKPDFGTADALTVSAEAFNINAALVRGLFIHGQVTDSVSHAALVGINVNAVDASINCCPFNNVGFSQTDSGGNYQILVPPRSRVKLQFFTFGPNALPYLGQWWNNKPDFAAADTLTVNQETFGINAALVRGVVVHGQVTDAVTHVGIPGINVGAVGAAVQCCPFQNINNTATDAGGTYALTVPVGTPLKLQFFQFPVTSPAYLGQWWNSKSDFDTADTLTLTQDTFGINAALNPALLIRGHVTDQATGLPLPGINVNAIEPSGRFAAGAPTDGNGDYSMAVAAGSYKVRFASDPSSSVPYPAQWWNGKLDFSSADLLVVAADRPGIDAALTLGAFVHGRVTDASTGAGIQGIDVDASDSTQPCCSSEAFAQTDSSGNYRIALRVGSTVRIHMFAFPSGSPPYIDVWWRDSRFFESADTLIVGGETFGIDAALAPGVFIHGQVTDAVTHMGIAGINVDVVQPDVSCCPFGDLDVTQTDAGGNYTVLVPRGSPFKIQFSSLPGNPPYVEQWWSNKPTFQAADILTINVETFGINVALVPG